MLIYKPEPDQRVEFYYEGNDYAIIQEDSPSFGLVYSVFVTNGNKTLNFEIHMTDEECADFLYRHHVPYHLVNRNIIELQKTIGNTDFLDYINKKFEGDVEIEKQ